MEKSKTGNVDGNLKSSFMRQGMKQQLLYGESRVQTPRVRKRGLGNCFSEYVSKVDQLIHEQRTKLMENMKNSMIMPICLWISYVLTPNVP